MGAVAYELGHPSAPGRQPRLFAVAGGAVAEPAAQPPAAPASRHLGLAGAAAPVAAPVRTLDAAVGALFAATGAGRQATCLLCGEAVRPVPGGAARCGGCGSDYE